jgi:DNA-binding response OmpR family regulator
LIDVAESLGRVLVVDDDAVIRQLITVNLELEGFEIATACDGQECLELVHAVAPDVVTLDVLMPRLGGFPTAAKLREDDRLADTRIVMISACAQESDLAKGREIGVDAYLTKPFDPAELIRTVRRLANCPERSADDEPDADLAGSTD